MTEWSFNFLLVTGIIQFENSSYHVNESSGNVTIGVVRQHGSAGSVGVRWKTLCDDSATHGMNYKGLQSEVQFQPGEVRAIII